MPSGRGGAHHQRHPQPPWIAQKLDEFLPPGTIHLRCALRSAHPRGEKLVMTSRIRHLDRRRFLAATAATGLSAGGLTPGIAWSATDMTPKRGGTIRHAKGHGNTN